MKHDRHRRFAHVADIDPAAVKPLGLDHPAIAESRPLFPSTVINAADAPRLLVSGVNSKKLGKTVAKGPLKGFPIYSLTLPERATCPASCHQYRTCYGNAMHWSRRHAPGPDLERGLLVEVADLARKNPAGFLVRLHTLGDFYSLRYVEIWERLLTRHPSLHCFGYTAFLPDATDEGERAIGAAIALVKIKFGTRFFIRWSSAEPRAHGSTVIARKPEAPRVAEGIVCPAETQMTACCATCGLCWNPDLWADTIVFVLHGMGVNRFGRAGRKPKPVAEPPITYAKVGGRAARILWPIEEHP